MTSPIVQPARVARDVTIPAKIVTIFDADVPAHVDPPVPGFSPEVGPVSVFQVSASSAAEHPLAFRLMHRSGMVGAWRFIQPGEVRELRLPRCGRPPRNAIVRVEARGLGGPVVASWEAI